MAKATALSPTAKELDRLCRHLEVVYAITTAQSEECTCRRRSDSFPSLPREGPVSRDPAGRHPQQGWLHHR
jgi:hypothetical protein